MYTKDKNTRITLRLNEQQFAFVKANADILGVSPSEFLRMVINSTMVTSQMSIQQIVDKAKGMGVDTSATFPEEVSKAMTLERSGSGRENDKADINDKL